MTKVVAVNIMAELLEMEVLDEMVYACDNCGFLFEMDYPERRCPDCGALIIRPAFVSEIMEYKGYQTEEKI